MEFIPRSKDGSMLGILLIELLMLIGQREIMIFQFLPQNAHNKINLYL